MGVNLFMTNKQKHNVYSIGQTYMGVYNIRSEGAINYNGVLDVKKITFESGLEQLDDKYFGSLCINKSGGDVRTRGVTYNIASVEILFGLNDIVFDKIDNEEQLYVIERIIDQANEYIVSFKNNYRGAAHLIESHVEFSAIFKDVNGNCITLQDLQSKVQIIRRNIEYNKRQEEQRLRNLERDSILAIRLSQYSNISPINFEQVSSNEYLKIKNSLQKKIADLLFPRIENLEKEFNLDIEIIVTKDGINDSQLKIQGLPAVLYDNLKQIIKMHEIKPYFVEYDDIERSAYIPTFIKLHYDISINNDVSGICLAKKREYRFIKTIPFVNNIVSVSPKEFIKYIKRKKNALYYLPDDKKPKFKELPLNKEVLFRYQCIIINNCPYERRLVNPVFVR